MEKFVPFEKLSKKKQRELNAGRRNVWEINPVTRKPANPRAYNRKKAQDWKRDRSDSVLSFFSKIVRHSGIYLLCHIGGITKLEDMQGSLIMILFIYI